MRNPLKSQRSARTADPGPRQEWTTKYQWPVRRTAGAELVFSLRVPPATRVIDVADLGAAAEGAPAEIRTQAENLRKLVHTPGGIICAAACVARANPADLAATLTAALAEGVRGVPDPDKLGASAAGEPLRRDVRRVGEKAVVIDQLSALPAEPGEAPIPMLLMQYLLQTRYGALSLAFNTSDVGIIQDGRQVFFDIASTSWIGETEFPDGLSISSASWSAEERPSP
jgi:hypothetical protein